MALQRPLLIKLLAPLFAFGLTLAVLALLNRSSSPPADVQRGDVTSFGAGGRSTDDQIRTLESAIRAGEGNAGPHATLGEAYLQKTRETGDPSFYVRAEEAFRSALQKESEHAGALAGMGSLALARHDFREALDYGHKARAATPGVVRYYGVVVDALVELGRYAEAERTLQRMVDLKPNLASYARVSYVRELHGDLGGAADAMRLAVSAGGAAAENVAYVQTLLGNLELDRGRTGEAESAYRAALASFPRYPAAEVGLARVEVASGELASAIPRYRSVVRRLPFPEYVVALAETELAAGRKVAARRDLDLVRVQRRLFQSAGVNLDVELAVFEANHGSPERALELAQRSWRAAPSVRSADALGWALTRGGRPDDGLAWARRALKLGSKDPFFLYHAGMSAMAAGRSDLARRYLARSLAQNPRFSPLYAPRARRALATIAERN
jgi:tetratricopeptide (TPR) repeat protein